MQTVRCSISRCPSSACARVRVCAARAAIDASAQDILLTGRSEGFIVNRPDFGETIRRLVAFAEAGAHCFYAPGIKSIDDLATVVQELAKSIDDLATVVQELAATTSATNFDVLLG